MKKNTIDSSVPVLTVTNGIPPAVQMDAYGIVLLKLCGCDCTGCTCKKSNDKAAQFLYDKQVRIVYENEEHGLEYWKPKKRTSKNNL